MYKFGRTDFIETNLKPALVEGHQHHMTYIETARADFERHLRRLLVVRQEKQKTWLDLMGMCARACVYGSDLSKWRHLAVEMVAGARHSDRKRIEIYNISQVMQLLADSSNGSGSGLNMSDPDVGCNSSALCGRG